jgi:hypothetical protein
MDFKVVLNITQMITKPAQYEKLLMAAYGPLIKSVVYSLLCAPTVFVAVIDAITDDPGCRARKGLSRT